MSNVNDFLKVLCVQVSKGNLAILVSIKRNVSGMPACNNNSDIYKALQNQHVLYKSQT